jgi:uncharacterized protein
MELLDRLLETERMLWTNNAPLYRDTLLDDAILIFPETDIISRDAAVEAIRQENAEGRRWAEVRFEQVRAAPLSEDAMLLTYRVNARWEHEREPITAMASSVYVRRGEGWKLAHHQQTALASLGSSGDQHWSENKRTVDRYMAAFREGDHAGVLACLTEDVAWEIPGAMHLKGKPAFDREIENEAFVGRPEISVTRLTEENDIVIAEGSVRTERRNGGMLNLRFCDVFEMAGGRIRRLISYLVTVT